MKKLICTRGIPASWKTTWSLQAWWVRYNKDDLRELFHGGVFSKKNERMVVSCEREWVEDALKKWEELVIVDNTHLGAYNKHIHFYKNLAEKYWYSFEIKDFYVSLEDAIERDQRREKSVWEEVIRRMFKQTNWWYPTNPVFRPEKVTNKPDVIIVDIDWTLAYMDGKRSPYDYSLVGWDRCNTYLRDMLSILKEKKDIFIVSGRNDDCKEETEKWLKDNWVYYTDIFMRKTWDTRKDSIVKKEIAEKYILPERNVFAVFDDRNQVVDMWRLELNLPTFQAWYWFF